MPIKSISTTKAEFGQTLLGWGKYQFAIAPNTLLRNGSSITTNATGSNIPGGNINIDTDNLVAVPSKIVTSAPIRVTSGAVM
jgi:hypothetical protein